MFVDKRTQDKIFLLPASGSSLPNELVDIIDPNNIPSLLGGNCSDNIVELGTTIAKDNINI